MDKEFAMMNTGMQWITQSLEARFSDFRAGLEEYEIELDEFMLTGVASDQRTIAWCHQEVDEDYNGNRIVTAVPKYVEVRVGDNTMIFKRAHVKPEVWNLVGELCTDILRYER